jgi:hypothetical protein
MEFGLLLVVGRGFVFLFKLFQCFHGQQVNQQVHTVFELNFILLLCHFTDFLQKPRSLGQISKHDLSHGRIVLNLKIIKGHVAEPVLIKLQQACFILALILNPFFHKFQGPLKVLGRFFILAVIKVQDCFEELILADSKEVAEGFMSQADYFLFCLFHSLEHSFEVLELVL